MKTIQQLTIAEAQTELNKHRYRAFGIDAIIIENPILTNTQPPPSIMEVITDIRNQVPDYKTSGKIAAIKYFREWAKQHNLDYTLVTSKNFVESLN